MKASRLSGRRVWIAGFVAVSIGCVVYLVFALHFLSFHFESSSKSPYLSKSTPKWTVADTGDWIKSQGFYAEANLFAAAKVDGAMLLSLSEWDVSEVVGVKDPGTRDAIYRNIARLRSLHPLQGSGSGSASGSGSSNAVAKAAALTEHANIMFYFSGRSFLEKPAFQIDRVTLDMKCRTLDDVKAWLSTEAGEAIESLKAREGSDIADLPMLKSLGKAYFLRKSEFYFFPIERVGGTLDVFIPSQKREVRVEMLSSTPRLLLAKNFLSREECATIIEAARPKLTHSTVAVVKGNKQESDTDNNIRTSSTAWLNAQNSGLQLMDDITRRVFELVKVPMDHAEDMQVLHYGYKQHYHAHHDYFDPNMYPTPEYKKGHNRMITVFMYLSDVEEGGETNFPYATGATAVTSYSTCDLGIKVKPKLGDCIVFYSMKAEAQRPEGNQLDPNSLHAGCDVLKGDKWSANYWIRNVPWRLGTQ